MFNSSFCRVVFVMACEVESNFAMEMKDSKCLFVVSIWSVCGSCMHQESRELEGLHQFLCLTTTLLFHGKGVIP